eukprot:scaffold15248_cov115-Isochrysis_galbana.AAC.5
MSIAVIGLLNLLVTLATLGLEELVARMRLRRRKTASLASTPHNNLLLNAGPVTRAAFLDDNPSLPTPRRRLLHRRGRVDDRFGQVIEQLSDTPDHPLIGNGGWVSLGGLRMPATSGVEQATCPPGGGRARVTHPGVFSQCARAAISVQFTSASVDTFGIRHVPYPAALESAGG